MHAGATCRHKQGGWPAGYLHEALITRKGIPAVLAVLYAEVMQRLLARRAVAFAVRIDCSRLDECAPVAPVNLSIGHPASCVLHARLWMQEWEATERIKHSAMHACERMQAILAATGVAACAQAGAHAALAYVTTLCGHIPAEACESCSTPGVRALLARRCMHE